ncbi:protein-L-isoaspartate(D-aspartate) O-methyltransferase [Haloechinothrix sp. LS1_15]|uniref:protein-L-isoaspartate(D-aspartate) O-methyltransferase n=1 Tax=Haloechinothrix sp. LS1_15 TaxID=2652248 RepID=UPI002944A743|nr:protein-L-isoaspartate(D-aspartate) O-methyltransferase [Haloechinothrix sp. LS1_15]MDV6013415.1 protein-L-isoaspartate(D-aspartate) O-methyltransferase [Haloechinothrix sp. LS1_15]
MRGLSSSEDLAEAVRAKGVRDERILAAMRRIPRAEFVPAERAGAAAIDEPVPITHNQVSTQPWLSARMFEGLRLSGDEHVLEIGTGSGFATALLSQLVSRVVSIDRWQDMIDRVERTLERNGIGNVTLLSGDGSCGVPEHAPFDAIVVSAAYPSVPRPLIEQLRLGGRLVQPIGSGGYEEVTVFERTGNDMALREHLVPARFVPLYGRCGYPEGGDQP